MNVDVNAMLRDEFAECVGWCEGVDDAILLAAFEIPPAIVRGDAPTAGKSVSIPSKVIDGLARCLCKFRDSERDVLALAVAMEPYNPQSSLIGIHEFSRLSVLMALCESERLPISSIDVVRGLLSFGVCLQQSAGNRIEWSLACVPVESALAILEVETRKQPSAFQLKQEVIASLAALRPSYSAFVRRQSLAACALLMGDRAKQFLSIDDPSHILAEAYHASPEAVAANLNRCSLGTPGEENNVNTLLSLILRCDGDLVRFVEHSHLSYIELGTERQRQTGAILRGNAEESLTCSLEDVVRSHVWAVIDCSAARFASLTDSYRRSLIRVLAARFFLESGACARNLDELSGKCDIPPQLLTRAVFGPNQLEFVKTDAFTRLSQVLGDKVGRF